MEVEVEVGGLLWIREGRLLWMGVRIRRGGVLRMEGVGVGRLLWMGVGIGAGGTLWMEIEVGVEGIL